jgi:hypothetical protein
LYFGNVVANYLPSAKVVDVRNNYYPNGWETLSFPEEEANLQAFESGTYVQ